MSLVRICPFVLAFAASMFAQDGFLAVAYKNVTLTPTEAVIQVFITTPPSKSLDDVVVKARELGLGVEHMISINAVAGGGSTYTFRASYPLSQTAATLQKLQTATTADFNIQAGVASVTATPEAIRDAQRQAFSDLYREAKSRADEMAVQAGLKPGRVLAVADTYQSGAAAAVYAGIQIPVAVAVRVAVE